MNNTSDQQQNTFNTLAGGIEMINCLTTDKMPKLIEDYSPKVQQQQVSRNKI